ncbi:hypothetical protein HNQ09_002189 [Deinococcus budaensis]|uniref:DUF1772 domain-containing protein n=1 Tax=Deinococcus budaensis TaxID=1665626 RepID=A0A7W8GFK2_9DEIO|nr:hypothetical protein [Deinococcus budaensis]MBB5234746.1 hypothetical protein [Deinococcus budaensis]
MLLVVHAALTWGLVGLILTVQLVHYPLFSRVGTAGYAAYQQAHVTRVTWLAAPLMLAELATGAALVVGPPPFVPAASAGLGLALIALIWLSTALVQSPAHHRLAAGFDAAWHARLVTTNWGRTLLWLTRGVLVGWWLLLAGEAPR